MAHSQVYYQIVVKVGSLWKPLRVSTYTDYSRGQEQWDILGNELVFAYKTRAAASESLRKVRSGLLFTEFRIIKVSLGIEDTD